MKKLIIFFLLLSGVAHGQSIINAPIDTGTSSSGYVPIVRTVNGQPKLFKKQLSTISGGGSGTVDASLSRTSTNAVQNQAVTKALNDVYIDVAKRYGVVADGATDNATALMQMRSELTGSNKPLYHLIMPSPSGGDGSIRYSNNRWTVGIERLDVDLNGSKLTCIYSGSDEMMQRPLNVGELFQNNTLTYTGSKTYETAVRFNTASAGETTITCTTTADAATFTVGNRILLYGYDQTGNGYPPGVKYFEWQVIESINTGTGVITLKKPLANSYSSNWWDVPGIAGGGSGKPRILNLDRSANVYNRYARFRNGTFGLATGGGYSSFQFASEKLIVENCTIEGNFNPSEDKYIEYTDVLAKGIAEFDKLVGTVICTRVDFKQSPNAGGGCESITLDGCNVSESVRFNAKYVTIRNCNLRQNNDPDAYAPAIGNYPGHFTVRRYTVENNTYTSTSNNLFATHYDLAPFSTLTVAAVSGNNILIPFVSVADNSAFPVKSIEAGVTKLFKSDGSKGGLVTSITFDGTYNSGQGAFVIAGDWQTPVNGETWTWSYINEFIDLGGNRNLDGKRMWNESTWRWAGNKSTSRIKETRVTEKDFDWSTLSTEIPYNARLLSMKIIVSRPYTGTEANAFLYMNLDAGTTFAKINLKQVGRRSIDVTTASGALTGDVLTPANIAGWCATMFYYKTGNSFAVIPDATTTTLPRFELIFEWMY